MVLYKFVNGKKVEMSAEEESATIAERDANSAESAIVTAYNEWKNSLPDHDDLNACQARIISALAGGGSPDAADVTALNDFILLCEQKPPKPGAE